MSNVVPICSPDQLVFWVNADRRPCGRRTRMNVGIPMRKRKNRWLGTCSLGDLTDWINGDITADDFVAQIRYGRP